METIKFAAFEQNELEPKTLPRTNSRPRSMTVLNLQWVGERVRKARKIKELIEAGEYKVSSQDVARALLGKME